MRKDEAQRFDEEQQQRRAIRIADLIDQMSDPKGRRFVWAVLKDLLYQQPITDTNAAVYGKVAKQAVSFAMARELKSTCRDLFYLMEIENDGLN